jgi:N-carbamoylputrescine amidase
MSANNKIRQIRIAAVQTKSCPGQRQANLQHVTPLIEQAAREGAQLIVLPELAASGYSMSKLVWDMGETCHGSTVRWLQETSRRLAVHIGIGFVEVDGEDFYNTYALSAPDGHMAGFVRKSMAETYCFRSETGPHVIETEIGQIGVGICAENLFTANLLRMQAYSADILLMPHAAPIPYKTGRLVTEKDIPEARTSMSQMATDRARRIGIPTVFINQVGERGPEKWAGLFGAVMSPDTFHLGGLSTIADADGTVLAQLDEQSESVAVANVMVDPSRKIMIAPTSHGTYGGGFVTPHPFVFEAMCYTDAFFCGLSYKFSTERRRKARAISSNGHVE